MAGRLALGDGAVAFATGFRDGFVFRAVAALFCAGFICGLFRGLGFAVGIVGRAERIRGGVAGLAFIVGAAI